MIIENGMKEMMYKDEDNPNESWIPALHCFLSESAPLYFYLPYSLRLLLLATRGTFISRRGSRDIAPSLLLSLTLTVITQGS